MRPFERHRDSARRASHVMRNDAGYVLMWVIFSFVIMGTIATAALLSAGTERQSAKAVADWSTSLYLAETGLAEIMGSVTDSALDELLPGDSIKFAPQPVVGGGTYSGVLHRVDDDRGQRMYNVQVEGRRGSLLSGVQHISMFATRAGPAPQAAVSVDGNLLVSGRPRITGTCGSINVGGRLTVTGELTVEGEVSAGEILVSGGRLLDPAGQSLSLSDQNAAPQDVPVRNTEDTCGGESGGGGSEGGEVEFGTGAGGTGDADLRAADDGVIQLEGGQVALPACADTGCTEAEKLAYYDALNAAGGVTHDGSKYVMDGSAPTQGTLCADADVLVSGELGSESVPEQVSILSEGSVEIAGNPHLVPHDPSGILIQADGDLKLNGNSTLTAPNFGGDVYALGQCEVSGAPAILGQVTCANQPNPVGSTEVVVDNKISGDALIHYDCPSGGSGSGSATVSLRPISRRAWRQIY